MQVRALSFRPIAASQSVRRGFARMMHMGEIATNEARATLTFWIPERVDALLAEHECRNGTSRSDLLRGILRQYLYGLSGAPQTTHARAMPPVQPARGQWGGRIPQLGKNSIEAKLWLPCRWRDDLTALAAEAGITRSHFAREVVVAQLLGHAYLPARKVDESAGCSNRSL